MPRLSRILLPLCGVLAALATSMAVHAADNASPSGKSLRVRPAFPALQLPDARSDGQRAVDLLGARLPEVAGFYGKSADELRRLLLKDRRLKLDRRGRMLVEETLDRPLPIEGAWTLSSTVTGTLAPLDQTYSLHSKPGAKRTVYLNFRGAQLTNTAWNSNGNTITALPFDIDGVPYSNSAAELERIQYIWQRVAEDYAPYDVDVTTEPPPADRITRSGSGDDTFGTVVLITARSGVYNCSCGGVAYIGVFDETNDFYKPALVFYDALGNGNEKYVAEAISHEAGHNGGLLHDGDASTGYYGGHGSGATGWAPIMGVGYNKQLVQWSKGEYAGANNNQDDYAVMATNGLPLRADDHGGTNGTASPLLAAGGGGLAAEGVIERPGDVDVFAFSAGAGAATVTAAPAARSPNADLRIELRNGTGTVIASANPADLLGASLSATLPSAGTYYVAVIGVGQGDPLGTGYSAYGSTGQYIVTATVGSPPPGGQPPVAVISATPIRGPGPLAVAFSGAGSSDPDGSIVSHAWTYGDGQSGTGAAVNHTYTAVGSYTAELRVTDNSGMSATRTVTITVDPVVAAPSMRVTDIAMSVSVNRRGRAQARALVSVRDGNGQAVPGASVQGRWSGLVARNSTVTTGNDGVASFSSPNTSSTSGSFVFTVTGITLAGYGYTPANNTETSDSIAR